MTRGIIAAAIAVGLAAGPAMAQDTTQSQGGSPSQQSSGSQSQQGPGPQAQPGSGPQVTLTGPEGPRRGPSPGRGPGGRENAGLELTLGDDIELQIDCGATPIRECLDATTPYLDMLRQMRN